MHIDAYRNSCLPLNSCSVFVDYLPVNSYARQLLDDVTSSFHCYRQRLRAEHLRSPLLCVARRFNPNGDRTTRLAAALAIQFILAIPFMPVFVQRGTVPTSPALQRCLRVLQRVDKIRAHHNYDDRHVAFHCLYQSWIWGIDSTPWSGKSTLPSPFRRYRVCVYRTTRTCMTPLTLQWCFNAAVA